MDPEGKPRKLRLISGTPDEVDVRVNILLDQYAPTSWTYQVVGERVVVTCMLVLLSEIRMMQLASVHAPPPHRQ